ncbi:MAG: type IV secretory system conjugative DNA transfer family protein [Lachnospiraceae bacterium]|nr:type IV secretory system conjugative DNA transfer family protein [Lachnospiraceae bacterium]
MRKADIKKILIMNIPYIITGYFGDKLSWLYRQSDADLAAYKISYVVMNFGDGFKNPLPSIHPIDILIGIVAGLILKGVVVYKRKNAKKFRYGTEFGSARWGTKKDIEPFVDENEENNIILTATESLTMNSRPKDPKNARNKNIVAVGGSGSGKTRFFVKPQLMQLHSSYCVTDPKGQVLVECGRMLQRHGYVIKVFNTINFKKSQHYNPFMYIRSEKDILKLVNTLVANTKGEGEKATEDFWVKSEKLLYQAYIGYIWYEAPEDEQNFSMLLDMINASEVREEDETFKNAIDLLFEDLEAEKPDHFAVRQYKKYKLSAGNVT